MKISIGAPAKILFLLFATSKIALSAPLPAQIRAQMRTGAIPLHFETRSIGPNGATVGLQLSVLPTGRDKQGAESIGAEAPTGPLTLQEIKDFPQPLLASPFTLDIFRKNGEKWARANSVTFWQTKNLQDLSVRWLDAKTKQAPILLLHFGYAHWHEWEVLTFPDGILKPGQTQEFFWGGEGEWDYQTQKFDQTDKNGRLIIAEETSQAAPDEKSALVTKQIYRFDGLEWRDDKAPYFVIGASLKTRAEAEKFRQKIGFGEIRPSAHYSKLRAGYFIVILARFATLKEAQTRVSELGRDSKITASVRRAF